MRYRMSFCFVETEAEAAKICEQRNANATAYCRRRHPAHYLPWENSDGKQMFVCLYFE